MFIQEWVQIVFSITKCLLKRKEAKTLLHPVHNCPRLSDAKVST